MLFLDGHTSRWSYEALNFLRDNRVIVFCLPAHTSIWSQPNDAGYNKLVHKTLGGRVDARRALRMASVFFCKITPADWNTCFFEAMDRISADCNAGRGSNAVVSGWDNTGLSIGNVANS